MRWKHLLRIRDHELVTVEFRDFCHETLDRVLDIAVDILDSGLEVDAGQQREIMLPTPIELLIDLCPQVFQLNAQGHSDVRDHQHRLVQTIPMGTKSCQILLTAM